MASLRPASTCKYRLSQAWARYSKRKPRKNYVKALPHTSLLVFNMGKVSDGYDLVMKLVSNEKIQLRSNSLESARLTCNKYLEANIPGGYSFKILVYPHMVIREHKMASGAGADRISKGMTLAFGKPVSMAARINKGQPIFLVKTTAQNRGHVSKAFTRSMAKISGSYKIMAE